MGGGGRGGKPGGGEGKRGGGGGGRDRRLMKRSVLNSDNDDVRDLVGSEKLGWVKLRRNGDGCHERRK